jgi:hypothetical protein
MLARLPEALVINEVAIEARRTGAKIASLRALRC